MATVCACLRAELLQSCLTLCDPMNCSLPGSSVHGIPQARILEWVAISSSRGSSQLRDWTHISYVSCIDRQAVYTSTTWGAQQLFVLSARSSVNLKLLKTKVCGRRKMVGAGGKMDVCSRTGISGLRQDRGKFKLKKNNRGNPQDTTSHLLGWLWKKVSRSVLSDSLRPQECSPPGSSVHGDSLGQNIGIGCHFLLQGIFPTQGSNPGLLHCKRILYHLSRHFIIF